MDESEFSAEHYFQTQLAPTNLDAEIQGLREFLDRHVARGTRVVLVTVSSKTHSSGV
jgi:hypothetical protein